MISVSGFIILFSSSLSRLVTRADFNLHGAPHYQSYCSLGDHGVTICSIVRGSFHHTLPPLRSSYPTAPVVNEQHPGAIGSLGRFFDASDLRSFLANFATPQRLDIPVGRLFGQCGCRPGSKCFPRARGAGASCPLWAAGSQKNRFIGW